MTIARRRNSLI